MVLSLALSSVFFSFLFCSLFLIKKSFGEAFIQFLSPPNRHFQFPRLLIPRVFGPPFDSRVIASVTYFSGAPKQKGKRPGLESDSPATNKEDPRPAAPRGPPRPLLLRLFPTRNSHRSEERPRALCSTRPTNQRPDVQTGGRDGSGGQWPEGRGAGRPCRAPRRGALRRRRPTPARRHRTPRVRQQVRYPPARRPAALPFPWLCLRFFFIIIIFAISSLVVASSSYRNRGLYIFWRPSPGT